MAGRSAKNNNRGTDLFGYFVSGKNKEFHTNEFAGAVAQGLTATGGVISDYTDGPAVYRAHIFTSSGTFDVTAPGDFGDTVEYLVVAGGGGGASDTTTGGGGAGGVRTNLTGNPYSTPVTFPVAAGPTSYTVTIGGGGAGGAFTGSKNGTIGVD